LKKGEFRRSVAESPEKRVAGESETDSKSGFLAAPGMTARFASSPGGQKTKAGQLDGCPAFPFPKASLEAKPGSVPRMNYQELSPREKARRKIPSQLKSLFHL